MTLTLPMVLKSVNWNNNIDNSFFNQESLKNVEAALVRIAIWSKQLEILDSGNPALCFVREMQVAGQQCCALIGLCLYKPSAASARTMVETCLYYTYFRSHFEELASLIRVDKYYTSKSEIMEYHKIHSVGFTQRQEALGLNAMLERWYSHTSAVIHGQIPGAWNTQSSLANVSFHEETNNLAVRSFLDAENLIHSLLLCTAGKLLWSGFAPDAKLSLLKGLPGEKRSVLGLDLK